MHRLVMKHKQTHLQLVRPQLSKNLHEISNLSLQDSNWSPQKTESLVTSFIMPSGTFTFIP